MFFHVNQLFWLDDISYDTTLKPVLSYVILSMPWTNIFTSRGHDDRKALCPLRKGGDMCSQRRLTVQMYTNVLARVALKIWKQQYCTNGIYLTDYDCQIIIQFKVR